MPAHRANAKLPSGEDIMAENKTQPTTQDVATFLATLEPAQRRAGHRLVRTDREARFHAPARVASARCGKAGLTWTISRNF